MAKTLAEWMCELMCGTDAEALNENIRTYAEWMIDNRCSIRQLCKEFDVPYTTMHRYLTEELPYIDDDLYIRCKNIMKSNSKNQKRDDKGKFR